ncbi:MAG: hypothetical protein NTX42_00395 [Methanothrix sp.]|nr:hypothetical protein [Methanothrix sp.]
MAKTYAISHHFLEPKYPADSCQVFEKNCGGILIVIGITMLKVMHERDAEVYRVLKNMKCVKEVYRILGEFPLFVIMQARDPFNLGLHIDAIREISNVTGIWHILVSNDDNLSEAKMGLSEICGSALG